MAAKKAEETVSEKMVFKPLPSPWRRFMLPPVYAMKMEGVLEAVPIWLIPEAMTADKRVYRCRVDGGEHDGKHLIIHASLLNHLPYERLPEDGVPDNSKP